MKTKPPFQSEECNILSSQVFGSDAEFGEYNILELIFVL